MAGIPYRSQVEPEYHAWLKKVENATAHNKRRHPAIDRGPFRTIGAHEAEKLSAKHWLKSLEPTVKFTRRPQTTAGLSTSASAPEKLPSADYAFVDRGMGLGERKWLGWGAGPGNPDPLTYPLTHGLMCPEGTRRGDPVQFLSHNKKPVVRTFYKAKPLETTNRFNTPTPGPGVYKPKEGLKRWVPPPPPASRFTSTVTDLRRGGDVGL